MSATGNSSSFKNEYDLSQISLHRGKDDSLRGIVDSFQTEYNNKQAFNSQSNWLPSSKKNQHVDRLTNSKSTQSRYSIDKKSKLRYLCSLDVPNWSIHWTCESSSLQGSRSCIHHKRIAPISLRICCLPKCLRKCNKYNLHQICSH